MSVSLLVGLLPYWDQANIGRWLEKSPSFDARSMKLCRNIGWTLSGRCRRKELFYLCLSLAHLLTLCHIEATSRKKGGTRTDPPALQGYHHSPPPLSPLISSAFALWANAELYILGPSLPFSLSFSLSFFLSPEESWKNLSILMLGLWNFAWTILGHNH